MGFVLTVIAIMLTLDGLWAWLSDRFLRGVRGSRGWRMVNGAFIALQAIVLLWVVADRVLDLHAGPPTVLFAAALIWHLIVLPVAVVLSMMTSIPLAIAQAGRRGSAVVGSGSETDNSPPPVSDPQPTTPDLRPTTPDRRFATPVSRRSFLRTAADDAARRHDACHGRLDAPAGALPRAPADARPAGAPRRARRHDDRARQRHPRRPIHARPRPRSHRRRHERPRCRSRPAHGRSDQRLARLPRPGPRPREALQARPRGSDVRGQPRPDREPQRIRDPHARVGGAAADQRRHDRPRAQEPVQLLGLRWGRAAPGGTRRENNTDAAIASSMDVTLGHLRSDAFPILLAHHPHAFDPAAAAGIPLTLAGHTHGGQLMLTDTIGFGPQMYRYWSGAYRKPDGPSIVVSTGVGNWFPLRVNAPAEIIHLTLRRG